MSTEALDRESMLALERVEFLARLDGHHGALEAAEELGFVSRHVGGAWALLYPSDATATFNRVLGLGLDRPASPEDLVALKAFYAEHGIGCFRIALCPAMEPAGFESTLRAAGFGTSMHLVKWVRDGSPAKALAGGLHIDRAVPNETAAMDELLLSAFGGRPFSVPFAAALIGRPHWYHYVARDGGAPVATAMMYVRDGFAWLGAAGTLASHRGRGVQGALIARRIDDARALGCHTLTADTAPDLPERPSSSYRNMERAGFRVGYRRPNWVYPDPGHSEDRVVIPKSASTLEDP